MKKIKEKLSVAKEKVKNFLKPLDKVLNPIKKVFSPIFRFFKKIFGYIKKKRTDMGAWTRIIDTAVISFLLVFFVECYSRHSFSLGFKFFIGSMPIFALNVLIVFLVLSISMLFRKRLPVLFLLIAGLSALGITNGIVLLNRVTPFAITDILLATSVWDVFTIYLEPWQINMIIILSVVVIIGIISMFIFMRREKVSYLHSFGSIAVSAMLVFAMIPFFLSKGILPERFTNLGTAYKENGFFYCFAVGVFDMGIDKPDDYTEESIDTLLSDIGVGKNAKDEKPNIVIVQLESYFDLTRLNGITFSRNPVANFKKLQKTSSYGMLSVPSIGAGTANTEFEVLSGMSLDYFGAGEYPYKTVMQDTTCETICYNLKEQGYKTHAIHNHSGTFYDRHKVYANLGFDTFSGAEYMPNVVKNKIGWEEDAVLTEEIMKALTSTPEQDFVFTVSVQPHGKYPDKPKGDGDIEVYGIEDEGTRYAWKFYVNELADTDAFIGELVAQLSEFDEDTVVVFYGDHLPNLEMNESMLVDGDLFATEYVIWANFEMEKQDKDLEAFQLAAEVLDRVGFSNGIFTKLHQNYSDNENYLHALELLEYDVLYGDYNVYGGNQFYLPTDMKLGTTPITITSYEIIDDELIIYGEGFTKFSHIMIDGKEIKTKRDKESGYSFLKTPLDFGDATEIIITVGQITKKGVFMSETDPFTIILPTESDETTGETETGEGIDTDKSRIAPVPEEYIQ